MHPGFPASDFRFFDLLAGGCEGSEILGRNRVGRKPKDVLFRSGERGRQDAEAELGTVLDGNLRPRPQRHVGIQPEVDEFWSIGRTLFSQDALKTETANVGLLIEAHVQELHRIPHF